MPFTPDTFVDGVAGNTPITAAKLNNLEQGVAADDGTNPASAEAMHDAATFVPFWAPGTAYVAGQRVISPNDDVVSAIAAHTSGSSFNPANWTLSSSVVPFWKPNTTYAAGQQVVAPTNDVVSAKSAFTSGASYAAASWSPSSTLVQKSALYFNVRDYGAVGDGVTDDTAAINAAIAAAVAVAGVLFVPYGLFMTQGHSISGVTGLGVVMVGKLKRIASGPATALLYFLNCSNLWGTIIRTDGNVASNGGTVTTGQQDVTLDGCTDVAIDQILSMNPASDSLYIRGAGGRIRVGYVSSVSTGFTGRNAVSVVKGDGITIDAIYCLNTGYSTQPGGLDIEPNGSTDLVNNVEIGSLTYVGVGTQGLSLYSQPAYGQIITNVNIGRAIIHKLSGTAAGANDVLIAGAKNVWIGNVQHQNDTTTNVCANIDNADNVTVTLKLNGGSKGINLGPAAVVTNLKLYGSINGTASHCVYIYALNNALIDMTLKNPANGFLLVVKNSVGTSDNVRFRGDWSKATTGTQVMSASGLTTGVTNWVLDGVDLRGWAAGSLFQNGPVLQGVQKLNCRGINFGTAAPTGTDQWGIGDEVRNSAPAVGSPKGWVCTASGAPGTWVSTGSL